MDINILLNHLPRDVTADELFDVFHNIYHEGSVNQLKMSLGESLIIILLKNFVHGKYLLSRLAVRFKDENEMMEFIFRGHKHLYPTMNSEEFVSKLFGKSMGLVPPPQTEERPQTTWQIDEDSAYNKYQKNSSGLTLSQLVQRLNESPDMRQILDYYTKMRPYQGQVDLAIIVMLLFQNLLAIIGDPNAIEEVLMPPDRRGLIFSLTQIISEYLSSTPQEKLRDSIRQIYHQLDPFGIIRDVVVAHLIVNSGILDIYQEIVLIDGLLCPSNNIKVERMGEFEYYYLVGFRDIDELKMIMKKNPTLQYNAFLSRIFGLTISLKRITITPVIERLPETAIERLPEGPRAWDLIFPETLTRTFPELNKELRDPFLIAQNKSIEDIFITLNDFHASYDHRVFPIERFRSYPMNRNMFLLYHSPIFLVAVRLGKTATILTLDVPLSRSMISTHFDWARTILDPVFIAIKNVGIGKGNISLAFRRILYPPIPGI